MPTINQLVRKKRKNKIKKSKAPVLGVGLNTIKKTTTKTAAKPKAAPILENPETGAFVSFVAIIFAYFLARSMLYVSKKKTVFYKI